MSNSIPTFVTERLILRPIELSHAETYEQNFACYEVISQLSAQVPWPYPKGEVARYLAHVIMPNQGTFQWTWVILLKDNPSEVIGCVDLWRQCKPENRGFWLGQKYWGKGFMTEAVEPTLDFAFHELGFEKLVFSNAVSNARSRRIKEKTGARFVAELPGEFVDPAFSKKEVWELTKEEWVKNRGPYIRLARPGDEAAIHAEQKGGSNA